MIPAKSFSFRPEDGQTRIDVRLVSETVWLSAGQIAELFQRDKSTISRHIQNVFDEGELKPEGVVALSATTAAGGKNYQVEYYSLDVIISVGYRVKSHRGVQFRIWATQQLRDYLVKGFVLNDEKFKQGSASNYFDQLLARIRDIRSSEIEFWRRVLEIYATSIDYDPSAEASQRFFATVQNKMHWASHGHTAAEVIHARSDSSRSANAISSPTRVKSARKPPASRPRPNTKASTACCTPNHHRLRSIFNRLSSKPGDWKSGLGPPSHARKMEAPREPVSTSHPHRIPTRQRAGQEKGLHGGTRGMNLPKDWHKLAMGDLGDIQAGRQRSPNHIVGKFRPYLRVANVQDGWLDLKNVKEMQFTEAEFQTYRLRRGDILLAEGQSLELVGRPAVFRGEIPGCCYQNTLVRLRPRKHDPEYVFYLCQHLFLLGIFQRIAKKTTSIAHLGVSRFAEVVAPVASFPEQRKIADILGTWDEALEKLDALIAAQQRRKRALMQQLLIGKLRLPGFINPWARKALSDVAEECSVRNGQKLDRTRLYAVTKAEGMIPMREYVQGAKIDRCQIVEHGWFAYNPMRINIGSIARWEHESPVMVSPDYVVFRTNESQLLSDYLNHVRRSTPWSDFVGATGNGSVRIRIWFDDLGYFKILLPPLEEQAAIATVLDTADTELDLLREQRIALDRQKRGLMERLLTGKLRVNIK